MTIIPHPAAQGSGRTRLPAGSDAASRSATSGRIAVPLGSGAAQGCGYGHTANPFAGSPALLAAADLVVDQALRNVFTPDPLLGPGLSQVASVLSSVVKRHGTLLEVAFTDVLKNRGRYLVMRDVPMPITVPTQELIRNSSISQLGETAIDLSGVIAQTVKLDLVVIDRRTQNAFIIEMKRGGGKSEARKVHQIEWILRCAQVQGLAFLKTLGFHVANVRAVLIDVYGRGGYSPDLSVSGRDIDRLFEEPVMAAIEAVTARITTRLRADVPELLTRALGTLEVTGTVMPMPLPPRPMAR
ncbi:hypothetical protein [Methylobacterium sp. Leaf94]|uniref:hypothetical protein n=1 Tax=Methylobacterium sp. Leaf94 TaxID=1736250 RepID=UPI000B014F56|nr:hypothetical protein [Methylobacterium sp. Leaf94]